MDTSGENAIEEVRRLRRTMRDLVALSTLPAIWVGLDAKGIAGSLADVLLNTLSLDLIYIRLAASAGEGVVEVVRGKQLHHAANVEAVRASLAPLLQSDGVEPPIDIPDPFEPRTLHAVLTRFGVGEAQGVLVAGSRRAGFPNDQDRLLLGVGANQTAIVVQRRRAEEQTRTILESITDAFYALDRDWRFTYLNRHAEKVLDRTKEDLLGKVIWDEYPGLTGSEFERAFHAASKDGVAGSVTSYYPDHARWYEVHAYPTANGLSVYFRDTTEEKQAEKERSALLLAAQSANRAKDEFMAMLGHELRNPLEPIKTALHLLRLRGVDAGERERAVIERQVQHLVRLIDDLLDVSRITGGKIELKKQRIEASEIVARAVEMAGPLLEQKRQQLLVEVTPGLVVTGDPARLAQVIANLLINAAKYSDPFERIRIEGTRQGADVVIQVTDTGSGIDPELLPKVFEMFVQDHQDIDRAHGGLGLGLAIVRNIVLLHGGTATAESAGLGHGSTFTVRLPASTDAEPAAIAIASSRPELSDSKAKGGRVLVVDDNVDAAELMAMFLELQGYEVRTVHDGPSALRLVEAFVPYVALLDIGLPSMSGYELAARLRERVPRVNLVAVTGYGQESDRVRARAAGFDAHLVKPVDLPELEKMMIRFASRNP